MEKFITSTLKNLDYVQNSKQELKTERIFDSLVVQFSKSSPTLAMGGKN